MMKKVMENNNVIMYHLLLKQEAKGQLEEIGAASSLHPEIMTILPEDIQIAWQYMSWKNL